MPINICRRKREVGVTQTLDRQSWSVFPNPFQNTLNIKHLSFGLSTIEIKDITGYTYGTLSTDKSNDLSHLSNSLYFIIYEGTLLKRSLNNNRLRYQ